MKKTKNKELEKYIKKEMSKYIAKCILAVAGIIFVGVCLGYLIYINL